MSGAVLLARSPHAAHELESPFASWDSPLLFPTLRDTRRRFVPLYALCAVVAADLEVVATGSGSKDAKIRKAASTTAAGLHRAALRKGAATKWR